VTFCYAAAKWLSLSPKGRGPGVRGKKSCEFPGALKTEMLPIIRKRTTQSLHSMVYVITLALLSHEPKTFECSSGDDDVNDRFFLEWGFKQNVSVCPPGLRSHRRRK